MGTYQTLDLLFSGGLFLLALLAYIANSLPLIEEGVTIEPDVSPYF